MAFAMYRRQIAPADYICGPGAVHEVGTVVRREGRRPLVIAGSVGFPVVEEAVGTAFADAGLPWVHRIHRGSCTPPRIEALAADVTGECCDVVVGIGGGKVLDTAKAVADVAGVSHVMVPTSPATCAALTALSVLYDEDGRWQGGMPLKQAPHAAVIDTNVVGSAPARLLAAGIVDALAKWHEVRLSQRSTGLSNGALSAAITLTDGMQATFEAHAVGGVNQARRNAVGESRLISAETAILLPGLISGLAGDACRLAAAHAVHSALTQLPGSHRSLHGELVGFGILVQMVLDSRLEEEIARTARFFAALGQPMGLEALGCSEVLGEAEDETTSLIAGAPAIVQAPFNGSRGGSPERVKACLRRADEVAREAARIEDQGEQEMGA